MPRCHRIWDGVYSLYSANKNSRKYNPWLNIVFVRSVTRRVPPVEQKLLTILEHLSTLPVFSGVHVAQSLLLCVVLCRPLYQRGNEKMFAWWCLMPLWTIFQLYHGGHIYWWRKPEDPEKTIDLSQITDTLYRIMLCTSHVCNVGVSLIFIYIHIVSY
jgi:hypothetical protein